MPLWKNDTSKANNAPKQMNIVASSNATGTSLYGNTTISAFVNNQVTTVEGYTAAAAFHSVHAGWALKKSGAGPVTALNITAGGTLYSNADTIKVTGGTANATANVVTSNTGVITSITNLASPGVFANNASANVTITTSTGSGATVTATLGGRANRRSYECLVASGSLI